MQRFAQSEYPQMDRVIVSRALATGQFRHERLASRVGAVTLTLAAACLDELRPWIAQLGARKRLPNSLYAPRGAVR